MNRKYKDLAKQIIADNQYLTLSTESKNIPWGSTVTYAFDKKYHLYFMSEPSSRHIKEIKFNNKVSASIFDSRQDWGSGLGLQIQGTVKKVSLKEIPRVIKLFFGRNYPYGGVPKLKNIFREAVTSKVYFFYQLIPAKIWVTDPEAEVDGRMMVNLDEKS